MNPLEWGPWLYGKFFANIHPIWGYLFACTIALVVALVAWTQIKDKYEEGHPKLQITYSMLQALPIVVSPGAKFYIMSFHNNYKSSVTYATNLETKEWYWPKKDATQDFIGLCQLGNQSDKIVFNILTSFGVHFKRPGKNMPDVAYTKQEVLIDGSIKPGDYARIYLVNESTYNVIVDLPDGGELEAQGQSGRQKATINRLITSVVDQIPPVLVPSRNQWPQ